MADGEDQGSPAQAGGVRTVRSLRTSVNARYWRIQHGPLSIGLLDEHTGQALNTSTKVLPMSPVAQ